MSSMYSPELVKPVIIMSSTNFYSFVAAVVCYPHSLDGCVGKSLKEKHGKMGWLAPVPNFPSLLVVLASIKTGYKVFFPLETKGLKRTIPPHAGCLSMHRVLDGWTIFAVIEISVGKRPMRFILINHGA